LGTNRAGNAWRPDRTLVAFRALVGHRHRFNNDIRLDHIDLEDRAGFDREIDIGAGEINVNRWAIGGRC
jgi:hypothetical protein